MKRMKSGKTYKFGDVVLAEVYFTDLKHYKKRPALVLFEEYNNVVVAGITSNLAMDGIPLTKEEGAAVESVIKLNYIFTISKSMILKKLFTLTEEKKKIICAELLSKLPCKL